MGAVGLALTSVLVVRHYKDEHRRHRDLLDPRTAQVRALIDEAEKLILLGRRGSGEPL